MKIITIIIWFIFYQLLGLLRRYFVVEENIFFNVTIAIMQGITGTIFELDLVSVLLKNNIKYKKIINVVIVTKSVLFIVIYCLLILTENAGVSYVQ